MENQNPRILVDTMDARYGLFGFFFAFQNRLQTVGDHFYEDITCKQFFLLACMYLFPDKAPTLDELSSIMGCSHQNTKQLINKLVAKDYLYLKPDVTDKRKLCIYTTEHARAVAAAYDARQTAFMEQLYDGISIEDAATVLKILTRMEQNLIKIDSSK